MFPALFIEILVVGVITLATMFRGILREDELEHGQLTNAGISYTCSMHPGIVRQKPGNCPVCKTMPLVVRENEKETSAFSKTMHTYKPLIIVLFIIFVVSFDSMLFYQYIFAGHTTSQASATGTDSVMAGMAMSGVSSALEAPVSLFSYDSLMVFMMTFMAGFFLVFGSLKLVNIKAFADRFATYDLIAKQWKPYGYLYPFIELFLGVSFIVSFAPRIISVVTVVVMILGAYGVWRKVRSKQKFTCACLGTKFDIPLTYVTVAENVGMAAMALFMLV